MSYSILTCILFPITALSSNEDDNMTRALFPPIDGSCIFDDVHRGESKEGDDGDGINNKDDNNYSGY